MTDVRGATDVLRVPPKPPKTRMRDGVPWYESTKSANIVKIDAVKSIKPRPWKREHYGVRRDIHEEMVSRCGGTRASRQALDLAIHLLRYEKEHRSQMDKAEKDEKREREELLERRRLRREAHLERERDKAQFMASWMNQGYDCLLYTSPSPRDRG